MATTTLPLTPQKEFKETSSESNRHEDHSMGQINNLNRNGHGGATVPTLTSATSFGALGDKNPDYRRREIRNRLRQKHMAKVPSLRWTKFMHSQTKNNIVAFIGEFIGTTMFLFFAFAGTQLANIETGDTSIQIVAGQPAGFNPATLFYISASFGFTLMVTAWIFFRISGGLFNPAVRLACALLGAIGPLRAILLFIAQMTAACFAAYLADVIFPTPLNVQTTLQHGTSTAQGVWIEAMSTALLVFTIIMLAVEKHRATFMAPIAIGVALFVGELIAVYYTGGSLNPARSFGPAAVTHDFMSNHWIYWVGPFVGTILAVFTYWLFKALEYEMANPGQDGDVDNNPTTNPNHPMAQIVEQRKAEVEEIRAIERKGGFKTLNETEIQGNVLGNEGVIGMALDGVREGDEIRVQRIRPEGEPDLEANWPATQGIEGAQTEKTPSFPKIGKKSSWAGTFASRKSSTAPLNPRHSRNISSGQSESSH